MSSCLSCQVANQDRCNDTYNQMIRFQTPSSSSRFSTLGEKCGYAVCDFACVPVSMIEGIGLMVCGVALCPYSILGGHIKLNTVHSGTNVDCKGCSPGCQCPPLMPFQFKDIAETGNSINNNTGISCLPHIGTLPRLTGTLPPTHVTSSVTACNCLFAGIEKIQGAACTVLCCPCSTLCLLIK